MSPPQTLAQYFNSSLKRGKIPAKTAFQFDGLCRILFLLKIAKSWNFGDYNQACERLWRLQKRVLNHRNKSTVFTVHQEHKRVHA